MEVLTENMLDYETFCSSILTEEEIKTLSEDEKKERYSQYFMGD